MTMHVLHPKQELEAKRPAGSLSESIQMLIVKSAESAHSSNACRPHISASISIDIDVVLAG